MPAKRHDWLKYKEDYFNSEIDELTEFFKNYDRNVSKHTYKQHTQGWIQEKEEFKKLIFKEGLAYRAKKIAKEEKTQTRLENLLKAKNNITSRIAVLIGDKESDFKLKDLKNVDVGYKIIKTELGEPILISENKNTNDTKIELSEDYKAFMRAIYE